MPVAGRKPKPEGQKRNRHKPTYDWVEVVDRPYVGPRPKLPQYRLGGRPWPTMTKKWWQVVRSMPHCVLWSDADWQFALDTALLAAEFHDGDLKVATELRQREKILGTTADARRDLRIRYVEVDAASPSGDEAKVTAIADYRAMLHGTDADRPGR